MDTVSRSSAGQCSRCGGPIDPANDATLCFLCALREYVDILRDVGRFPEWFNEAAATTEVWRSIVGFAPADGLSATVMSHRDHPDYPIECYSVHSAEYHAGQVLSRVGHVWLMRVRSPEGMVYETVLPAGRIGDERAILTLEPKRRRAEALPERMINTTGVAAYKVEKHLTGARRAVAAMPSAGGTPRHDADDEIADYLSRRPEMIRKARERGGGKLLKENLATEYGWSEETLSNRMKKAGDTMSKLKRLRGGHVPR